MRVRLNRTVNALWFQRTIMAVILLAGILAGLETSAGMRERHGALLYALDSLVLALFIIEMLVKIGAHGHRPWDYFRDGWNVFDFSIVVLCCLPMDAQFAAVLRIARGLRLLRLVTALPKLQLLVGALLKSLGAMGYVGLLLTLVFYIYGVAGVSLFGERSPQIFGSLPVSLLTLFRLITLDNWSDLFAATQVHSPIAAPVYFVSFILLGTMIMLNLFIGVITSSMSEMHAEMEERDRRANVDEHGQATVADELVALEKELEALKQQTARVRTRLKPPSPGP